MFGKSNTVFLGDGRITESLKVSVTATEELKRAIEGFIRMNRKVRKIHFWVTDVTPNSGKIEVTFEGRRIYKRFWKMKKCGSPMRMTCFVTIPITDLPEMEVMLKKKELEKKFKRKFDMTVIAQYCKGTHGKILVVLLAEESK